MNQESNTTAREGKRKRHCPSAGPWLSAVFACAILIIRLPAQQVTQPSPPKDESIVELSPFVVTTDSNNGYSATNTLAGTRLNTPLKDIGTAISVVTKEFMDDIGASNVETLLAYTTGTEVGGLSGNFAGSPISDGRPNSNDQRENPNGNQRVRGLARAELSRNYFLTDIPFDSYNTDSITINRGPNSLLFGIGSAGGVINNSTITPVFGRDFNQVALRFGQRGSHRETLDINKTIIPGRLGLRFAALNENTKFRQRPAFESSQRAYLALQGVLHKGERDAFLGSTIVRGSYEKGETDGNPPNQIPPNDGLTNWWSLPSGTDFESYTGRTASGFLTNGSFVPQRIVDRRLANAQSGFNNGPYISAWFLQMALFYPGTGSGASSVNGLQGGMGTLRYSQLSAAARRALGVNGDTTYAASRNLFGLPFYPNFTAQSIDRRVFDYYNYLLAGDNGFRRRDFDTFNVTLEQSFWDYRAGFEIAFDSQDYTQDSMLPFGGGQSGGTGQADINVDVNQVLYVAADANGDGSPEVSLNPNAGRAMVRERGAPERIRRTQRDAERMQLYLKLNGEDLFGNKTAAWLFGKHTLTGSYIAHRFDTKTSNSNIGWDSKQVNVAALVNNQTINQGNRLVHTAFFLSDNLLGVSNPLDARVSQIKDKLPSDGDTYKLYYWQPGANGSIQTAEFFVRRYLGSEDINRTKLSSEVVSWQSDLLGGNLKGLVGWRKDSQTLHEMVDLDNDNDPSTEFRLPDGEWNPASTQLNREPVGPKETARSVTWSVVGVYPEKWLPRLPLDAELRLFINGSENFEPSGARRNLDGQLLPSPSGTTKEWGGIIELFKGKYSARVNFFETAATGSTYSVLNSSSSSIVTLPNTWANRYLTAFANWKADPAFTTEAAALAAFDPRLIAAGLNTFDKVLAHIFTLQPEGIRSQTNYRIETVNGQQEVRFSNIDGLVATSDYLAKGWELELVANPNRNLRLAFNIAKQETIQTNLAPDLKKYTAEMLAILQASPMYNVKDVPDSPDEPNTLSSRFRNAVTANLTAEAAKEGTVSLEQRKYRANIVANYTFRNGWLKGFNLGGAARYQSAVATGYPTIPNEDGNPVPLLDRAFFTEPEIRGDVFCGYQRKIYNGRVDWKIQLNIRDAFGSDDPIPVWTNPDGQVAVVRIPPLTEVFLTNTFKF